MIGNFQRALKQLTWRPDFDGQGYHDTVGDRGGPTNEGVTFTSWTAWEVSHQRPRPTLAKFRTLKQADFEPMILASYWMPVNGDGLPNGVDLLVYDFGYGSGVVTSAMVLQKTLGVEQDGHVGPATIGAAAERGPALIDEMAGAHAQFYRDIVKTRPSQAMFLNGWLRRNSTRQQLAHEWVKGA